ncbi:hypothetical protein AGLY_003391 [Aphis glycines]|uniref:CCHC-type domain-containing protein n=1 Tax=Aphis glycines TaxID=307491 RepID=A0A6G0TZM8_APHGL|nr:hypothetical protein AGLY_003391 [Aphis glycines]
MSVTQTTNKLLNTRAMTCTTSMTADYRLAAPVRLPSCKRIKGSHNYLNIAEVMTEITQNYGIHYSKITHTVTHNASNFGNPSQPVGDLNENNSDLEIDTMERIDVEKLFNNLPDTDDSFCLPHHLKCRAHTLNLIATTDIAKITDTNYLRLSESTFKKLYNFWNLISRSTVASDKVLDICGCKFPVPIITRWNSLYDASLKILKHKSQIVKLFDDLHLTKLKLNEWVFLEEYSKTMEPLAISLDTLQGENRNLKHCKPLSLIIIKAIKTRFSYLFDLSSPESKIFIISSISHPKFKLSWVPVRFINDCKTLFLKECSVVAATSEHFMNSVIGDEEIDSDNSDNELYSNFCTTNKIDSNNIGSETKTLNNANLEAISFLSSTKKDLDILNQYPIVKEVFLKYNTIIPSSAPIERLFSKAIQVLIPMRNRLNDKTVEMILCYITRLTTLATKIIRVCTLVIPCSVNYFYDGRERFESCPRVCTGKQMGQLTEFKLKEDDFDSWIERFELYVTLNEINVHKKQLLFLTLLGNDGYALLRDLCTPNKPIDKKYDDLKSFLTNYINSKPNLITDRYKFKERRQAANETVIQFITGLKKMSGHCEFGTVLDDALRDQVIWGIRDSNIKKRLLSEGSLTFKKCIELSLAMESANNDISKMEHHKAVNYHKVSKKKNTKFLTKVKQSSSNNSGKIGGESIIKGTKRNWVCYCCGKSGHTKPSCKYIIYKCSICNKVEHIVISESVKESEKKVELETKDKVEEVELRKIHRVIKPPIRLNL